MLESKPQFSNIPTTVDDPEEYARESFTWRRMTLWQLWSITLASVGMFIAAIVSEMM